MARLIIQNRHNLIINYQHYYPVVQFQIFIPVVVKERIV